MGQDTPSTTSSQSVQYVLLVCHSVEMWAAGYMTNPANFCEEYCGPLLLSTISGIPNHEKIPFNTVMMPFELMFVSRRQDKWFLVDETGQSG